MGERNFNEEFGGVSRADGNTINGPWAENRGRRGDQLRLDNPFENGELSNWKNFRGVGPRGYSRQDSRILEDVNDVLTRDREIDASEIDVNIESGVVTLTGKVEDRKTKRYAGHIIENISGVRDVQNLLEFDKR